jgi:hypothetical protein
VEGGQAAHEFREVDDVVGGRVKGGEDAVGQQGAAGGGAKEGGGQLVLVDEAVLRWEDEEKNDEMGKWRRSVSLSLSASLSLVPALP